MGDIDPLTGTIGNLQDAVNQPATAAGDVATVELAPDGTLTAIHLTDHGRRLDPDTLVEAIVRLHATAMADARGSVADAVARLENDPRLRAQRDGMVDALSQPLPRQADSSPPGRQPTPQEEEEMDRYYQRTSWLE